MSALVRDRPRVLHHHPPVAMSGPERAERAKAGLPVVYEYCHICGRVPTRFIDEGAA